MIDRALRAGMDVVERTFYNLTDAYAVPIAESHRVLDETDEQCPQALCFYVQGHSDPYDLEFTPRRLVAMAAHQGAVATTSKTWCEINGKP